MDKLDDLFRGFRSGVTAPSEDAVSAARELLLGEIGSSERPRPSRPKRRWAFVRCCCCHPGRRASRHAGGRHRRSPPRSDRERTRAARGSGSCLVARRAADRLPEPRANGSKEVVRRERRRERAAEADARREVPRDACLVARRAEDRLRRRVRRHQQRLCRERRRKRAAQAGAQRAALLPGRPTGERSRSSATPRSTS